MKAYKIRKNFTLSEEAVDFLELFSDKTGIPMSQIVEIGINHLSASVVSGSNIMFQIKL